jgi:hypothetical protein
MRRYPSLYLLDYAFEISTIDEVTTYEAAIICKLLVLFRYYFHFYSIFISNTILFLILSLSRPCSAGLILAAENTIILRENYYYYNSKHRETIPRVYVF